MTLPKVSVLVPSHNYARFLDECFESVLEQDFTNFELVVVDDASTDDSLTVIQRHAARDSRIRWEVNPKNVGLAANFNRCLALARGEYVKFVLADDRLARPDALRCLVGLLDAHPAAALASSAARVIGATSGSGYVRNQLGAAGLYHGLWVLMRCLEEDRNLIGEPSAVLFRRAEAGRGFDERCGHLVDLEMWFHLLSRGHLAYSAEPLFCFRRHAAQRTTVNRAQGVDDADHLRLLDEHLLNGPLLLHATNRALFAQIHWLAKRSGDRARRLEQDLRCRLGRGPLAAQWLRHKCLRPARNLRDWLAKRRVDVPPALEKRSSGTPGMNPPPLDPRRVESGQDARAPLRHDLWLRAGAFRWLLDPRVRLGDLPACLAEPQRLLEPPAVPLKPEPGRALPRVVRLALPGLGDGQFVIKRTLPRGFRMVCKNLVRRSPAHRAFLSGLKLQSLGLPVAAPLAAGERRRAGLLLEACAITPFVPDAVSLHTLNQTCRDPRQRRRLGRRLAVTLARLHDAGLSHRDPNLTNFLARDPDGPEPTLVLIDLEGLREHGRVSLRRAAHDLRGLHAHVPAPPRERWRFLVEYCRQRSPRLVPRDLLRRLRHGRLSGPQTGA